MVHRHSTSDPLPLIRTVAAILAVGVGLLVGSMHEPDHALAKSKARAKAKMPDLKILSVEATPAPFFLNELPLTLTITVALPKGIPDDALLDVTTLITSPSKTSFRLLTNRQMVAHDEAAAADDAKSIPSEIQVMQTWDGTDHTKNIVADGMYDYQVQAKLMVPGKNGPLLRQASLKKRGKFEVRTR
jgi:hypothetical protein